MNFRYEGKIFIVFLPIHFIGATAKDFIITVREAICRDIAGVTLDFSGTELIDSCAIGTMVSILKETKIKKIGLVLKNLREDLTKLLTQTGLINVFTITNDSSFSEESKSDFETLIIKEEKINDKTVLRLIGRMNHPSESNIFKQTFSGALSSSRKVLLDLSELTYIDSLGVSSIMLMFMSTRERGGKMAVFGATRTIEDVFTTFEIHKVIPNFHSYEEAIRAIDN